VWRGVPLHLLLKKCGIYTAIKMEASMFVSFEDGKDMPGGGGSKYRTSIKKEFALDPFWLMGILGFGFSNLEAWIAGFVSFCAVMGQILCWRLKIEKEKGEEKGSHGV
jgi:nitrate reductase (NAD(P)H)